MPDEPAQEVEPVEPGPVMIDRVPVPGATPQTPTPQGPSPDDLIERGRDDYSRGDYASAEARFQHALDILEGASGSNPLLIANALENLARVYEQEGRAQDAEAARERARTFRGIS